MSDLTQIALIKTQTLARLVEITAEQKPTYNIDGQQVSWNAYADSLRKTIAWADEQLANNDPVELLTVGYT